jgi:hypothetical protein
MRLSRSIWRILQWRWMSSGCVESQGMECVVLFLFFMILELKKKDADCMELAPARTFPTSEVELACSQRGCRFIQFF